MTGLDLAKDALIEVAALVTDPDLNVLGDGVDVVIRADERVLGGMVEIVREMHDKSGLTDAVRASAVSLAEAEDMVMS
ncbi:MAG TPA: oligoribonuclease, partial [Micromonosporaceae bacterium]